MATKAERFNEQQLHEKHHKAKQPPHEKPIHPWHNDAARAARHSAYELEHSAARPSRKSSRKSANRQKHDGQAKVARVTRMAAPSERASRPNGNPN